MQRVPSLDASICQGEVEDDSKARAAETVERLERAGVRERASNGAADLRLTTSCLGMPVR